MPHLQGRGTYQRRRAKIKDTKIGAQQKGGLQEREERQQHVGPPQILVASKQAAAIQYAFSPYLALRNGS
ncbi:MAG: hypothetical protein Q9215_005275 [Flavoplaca cf. flavocitrina]